LNEGDELDISPNPKIHSGIKTIRCSIFYLNDMIYFHNLENIFVSYCQTNSSFTEFLGKHPNKNLKIILSGDPSDAIPFSKSFNDFPDRFEFNYPSMVFHYEGDIKEVISFIEKRGFEQASILLDDENVFIDPPNYKYIRTPDRFFMFTGDIINIESTCTGKIKETNCKEITFRDSINIPNDFTIFKKVILWDSSVVGNVIYPSDDFEFINFRNHVGMIRIDIGKNQKRLVINNKAEKRLKILIGTDENLDNFEEFSITNCEIQFPNQEKTKIKYPINLKNCKISNIDQLQILPNA
jgi:hypothetical protein